MEFEELLQIDPYSLCKIEKERILTERLCELTELHKSRSQEYARILRGKKYEKNKVSSWTDLPFLPVRLFKEFDLKSVNDDEIVKTMTSSGTTGQSVSKIFLDRTTASKQQKVMIKIVKDFTGSERMPMIIIDCPSVIKNRNMFSARGAGILGFSMFATKKIYALDDDMKLNVEGIEQFLNENSGKRILLFGFTFMIWQYFYKELVRLRNEGIIFDLSNAIMIHGGGWKKLASQAVTPDDFKNSFNQVCGLDSIHDYYGMVEQTGCIYMQCECGHLHASVFSDVVTRRSSDFSVCDYGEKGIIQVVSTIPESYPGHSLLTEDEGIIIGEDDCPCGRKGKYFELTGRIKNAEIRGCSDTFTTIKTEDVNSHLSSEMEEINRIEYLLGNNDIVRDMQELQPMLPFDDCVIDFLDDVSKELMMSDKRYPDVVTVGFWLRKAHLTSLKSGYSLEEIKSRIGKGVAFHIAPSNVPVNFAYSLVVGLLSGNANIVRVSTKLFPQVELINQAIQGALNKHPQIRPYICIVRYNRNKIINDYFSKICDIRVIWGGDNTIDDIRRSPIGPRSSEVTFADRFSLAVIDSDYYLSLENKGRVALDFYNDTYMTDQNACTSPRAVIWVGKHISDAKEIFWNELRKQIEKRYAMAPIQSIDKLSLECRLMASGIVDAFEENNNDNLIYRIHLNNLPNDIMSYKGNSGYFYEYECTDIMKIRDICNTIRCQTIGLIGDIKLMIPLLQSRIKGVDRITRIGHTMDFELVWDGYDLISCMTRRTRVLK